MASDALALAEGIVFGIQHFSIHDGSGIRSNVFLRGCPLRCLWCHNPEGLGFGVGLQYFADKCVGCGACGGACNRMAELAHLSDAEAEELAGRCKYRALRTIGRRMTAAEVVDDVAKDFRYFSSSGGGMTVSGGEPMAQPSFTLALMSLARERGIGTALETSGCGRTEDYLAVLPVVDEFLYDYKATGGEAYRQLVGIDDRLILHNLQVLHDRGARITLRCPIIPGVNDMEAHLAGIADLTKRMPGITEAQLMPYHRLGVGKARRLGGTQSEYEVPQKEQVRRWAQRIFDLGGRVAMPED